MSLLIHWKMFALSMILFFVGAYTYLRYVVPVYSVGASIILKDIRRGGMNNSELAIFEQLDILDANSNVENEVDILQSRNLLERVVIKQRLFIRYSVEGRFKSTELYDSGNSKFYSTLPVRVYVDSATIAALNTTIFLTVSLTENSTVRVEGSYGYKAIYNEFISLPAVIETPVGDLLLAADENVSLKKDYPLQIRIMPPLQIAGAYAGALDVILSGRSTTVVRLSLPETHPKRGEDFLSTLVELYNEDTMEDKNKAAQNASNFISARLLSLKDELNFAEKSLQDYREDNHIASLQDEAELYITEEHNVSNQLLELETRDRLLSYLLEIAQKEDEFLPSLLNNVLDNNSLIVGIEKYNRFLTDKKRNLTVAKESMPLIQRLDDRLARTKEEVIQNIKSMQHTLEQQRLASMTRGDAFSANVGDVPRRQRESTDYLREQDIKAELYVFMSKRLDEIRLTLAVTVPSAKIIEYPITLGQISPRRMYIYMLYLMIGFIFPYIVIGLREMLNYRLTNEEEIRRFIDTPVVVSLPYVKTKDTLVVTPTATSPIVERFRLLRTNLQFVLDSPEKKSILVTSTISGEGKTFLSINLAMIFSLKYKTILVGLDIRRPKINTYLNLPKQEGLIAYLTGEKTNLDALIYKNVNDSDMDVLITGIIPPNPNELLMEKTLDNLFQELRERYDYIIIDSSPVGSVSDAFLLDRVSDVALFVIRKDYSPKSSVSLVNNIFEEKRLKNVNIVLNAFNAGKIGRYGYGYYGGGGYGYESNS